MIRRYENSVKRLEGLSSHRTDHWVSSLTSWTLIKFEVHLNLIIPFFNLLRLRTPLEAEDAATRTPE